MIIKSPKPEYSKGPSSISSMVSSESPADASLHLYSVTLQKPTAFVKSIVGHFMGKASQEIIAIRGSYLELYRIDKTNERLVSVLSQNLFGILRSVASFRIAGSSKDHIIITSDSGRVIILDYNPEKNVFDQLHSETYGKTGIRRIVPGQYLAVDPKGRAALIASVEKNKLVYVLNRDSSANVTISSPLEAHTPRTLVYDIQSVDVGYENPMFAALEVDYSAAESDPTGQAYEDYEKRLTFYELDLGLNHVVRKWTTPVHRNSSFLLQVPGSDGESILPSGMLVATTGFISYRNINQPELRVPIPIRSGTDTTTSPPSSIIAGVMHKIKNAFFFLVQNEQGDLFKMSLEYNDEQVTELTIQYFDTIANSVSLNILKSGFLFAACETGNHTLYRFLSLGDDDDSVQTISSAQYLTGDISDYSPVFFEPRALTNLSAVNEIQSLHPMIASEVVNLDKSQEIPQIYTAGGQSVNSSFKTFIHGIAASEVVASELPDIPTNVWTTKLGDEDEFDKYIIFSFRTRTMVLSIGESVEEVSDSGFLLDVPTLAVEQLGRDSVVQIHDGGIRHIGQDLTTREWEPPYGTHVVAATTNNFQIVIALSNKSIVYFELDDEGQLNEFGEHKELPSSPITMSMGKVPDGKLRSLFLAVGCEDSTIRIFSLDLDSTLEPLAMAALSAPPSDILIQSLVDNSFVTENSKKSKLNASPQSTTLYLHIGLSNGIYVMSQLDVVTGQLSNTRKRFLGPKPIQLVPIFYKSQPCILALSSTSWLGYMNGVNYEMTPLAYSPLFHATALASEVAVQGIVGTENNIIKIFTIEDTCEKMVAKTLKLKMSPKRFTRNSKNPYFYVAEAEYNTFQIKAIKSENTNENGESEIKNENEQGSANGTDSHTNSTDGDTDMKDSQFDTDAEANSETMVRSGFAKKVKSWASCIQIVDPVNQKVLDTYDFYENEAAMCVSSCYFASRNKEYLVVGVAKDLSFLPTRSSGGFIYLFQYFDNGKKLKFLHKTPTKLVPSAMSPFQGRLLIGLGNLLCIYDVGLKQLLRKCECKLNINTINTLSTEGDRIVVGDIRDSLTYVVYKPVPNSLIPFADDSLSRHITSTIMLDYETCICGDRFGNIFVLRCPPNASKMSDEDQFGGFLINQPSYLNGCPNKLDLIAHFYVGDIPTGLSRASLAIGGRESVIFSGIQGSIGAIVPFATKKDSEFMSTLERLMRTHAPPLSGRHHLVYRSYYAPVKMVVDGDLCEQFPMLPEAIQEKIAGELERDVKDICRKIDDMRIGSVF